jgi:hypothetical protein
LLYSRAHSVLCQQNFIDKPLSINERTGE